MNLVSHLFKKDVRRLRVSLIFWFLTVLLASGVNLIQVPTGDLAVQSILRLVLALVAMCQFIMMALIVPFLMHSEPLTGTTAFWLTRPIKRSDVLKSKLLFAGLFLLLLPVVTNVVLLVANQVPVAYILASVPETLLSSIGSLLLLMTLSVLTRSFGRFALAGGGYLIIMVILGVFIGIFRRFYLPESAPTATALTDSRALLSGLGGVLLLSAIIFFQYRTRRTGWAFLLLAMELILVLCIGLYCPWTLFRMPAGALTEKETGGISLVVADGQFSYVSDAFSLNGNKNPKKNIQGEFQYSGLPTNSFAVFFQIDAIFAASDEMVTSTVFKNGRSYSSGINESALDQVLAPLSLIKGNKCFSSSSVLLKITEADYLAVQNIPGLYEADVSFNVFRYQLAAFLPLEIGAEYSSGVNRQRIESVFHETRGCTVILRQQSINPLFKRDRSPGVGGKYLYLLVNKKTGDAYLPERANFMVGNISSGSSLSIQNKPLRFSSIDKGRFANPIDEDWLKDAELMIIETQWLGDAIKHVEDETFSFGDSGGSGRMKPDTGAKDNAEALSKIEFPDNASREEVEIYIQKINKISSTQSSFSPNDLQVCMLAEVGPENVDLLIQESKRFDNYNIWAIEKIAGPEHKELILQNLSRLPDLITVVVKHEWEIDAREVLLKGLKTRENLPRGWIHAVAGLEDPETYPALIMYFENGSNKIYTYNAIRNLSGVDLTDAVLKAWKQVRYSSVEWEVRSLSPVAIEYGIVDSLDFAARQLLSDQGDDWNPIREAVNRYVGVFYSDENFSKWLKQNKGTIYFDSEAKLFVGEHPPERPANPEAQRVGARKVSLDAIELENELRFISLPDQPGPEDIKAYVKQVRDACDGKRTSETEPMRTAKLVALGPENAALLIQESEWVDGYAIPAIKELVQPADKVVLLENLERVPSFMAVVLDQGWEGEIKEFVLEKIRGGYYPISWVQAAIRFDEPEAYAAALEHFVRTTNRHKVYQEIKNAQGIDKEALEVAVRKAWAKSKQGRFPVEWWTMISVAMEYGIQDSLYFAAKALLDDQTINENFRNKVRAAVHKHVGQFATDEAFREWLTLNKGAIQFDPKTKMFYGTQLAAPQPEPKAASAE